MNVHHHGAPARQCRRQHIEVKAILAIGLLGQRDAIRTAAAKVLPNHRATENVSRSLHAARTVRRAVALADPIPGLRWWEESGRPLCWTSVWNPPENSDSVEGISTDFARICFRGQRRS